MTKVQMAKYNRLSTKCHAYVREYHPDIYQALFAQVERDWNTHQYRRTSKKDIQRAISPRDLANDIQAEPVVCRDYINEDI